MNATNLTTCCYRKIQQHLFHYTQVSKSIISLSWIRKRSESLLNLNRICVKLTKFLWQPYSKSVWMTCLFIVYAWILYNWARRIHCHGIGRRRNILNDCLGNLNVVPTFRDFVFQFCKFKYCFEEMLKWIFFVLWCINISILKFCSEFCSHFYLGNIIDYQLLVFCSDNPIRCSYCNGHIFKLRLISKFFICFVWFDF